MKLDINTAFEIFCYGVDYGQLTMERERETEGVVDAFNCYFTARKTAMPSNPLPARQIHSEKWFAAKNESVKKFKELLAELGRGQDGNT